MLKSLNLLTRILYKHENDQVFPSHGCPLTRSEVKYLLSSREIIERKFSVLKLIQDNYPKYVISMDTIFGSDFFGDRIQ